MNSPTLSPEDVLVRAQDTPNPNAIKFVVNHILKESGKATFYNSKDCRNLVLFEGVLNIKGIKQMYVYENTMTVTFDDSVDPEDVKDCVKAVIKTRLAVHDPNFTTEEDKDATTKKVTSSRKTHEMPILNEIEEILDRTIRPGLQVDGGDVEVMSFKENELRILYQGACGGCPSSSMGTLDAIQNILRNELSNDEIYVIPI